MGRKYQVISFLLLPLFAAVAQPKGEVKEFVGYVNAYQSGTGLAYSRITLTTEGEMLHFKFPPQYGEMLTTDYPPGARITVRARVFPHVNRNVRTLPAAQRVLFENDQLIAVKKGDGWIEFSMDKPEMWRRQVGIFMDVKVKAKYELSERQRALVFDHGLTAYNWFYIPDEAKPGDIVSFRGNEYPIEEGFVFPIPNVKRLYYYRPLRKVEGTIKSLLFKQNYLCIGINVETRNGEVYMGFPSNYGQMMRRLAERQESMTFYFDSGKTIPSLLDPPELAAIVNRSDTILIDSYGTYGGFDIPHDHKPARIEGKISRVNRDERGKVLSIVIGNDCYIPVSLAMEKQLTNYFKKGQMMEISGDERVKGEGEYYSRNYRIITPRTVVVDGKNFVMQ